MQHGVDTDVGSEAFDRVDGRVSTSGKFADAPGPDVGVLLELQLQCLPVPEGKAQCGILRGGFITGEPQADVVRIMQHDHWRDGQSEEATAFLESPDEHLSADVRGDRHLGRLGWGKSVDGSGVEEIAGRVGTVIETPVMGAISVG